MVLGHAKIFGTKSKKLFDVGPKAEDPTTVVLNRLSATPGKSGLGHASGSAQTTKAKEGQVQVFRLIRGGSRAWFGADQQCIFEVASERLGHGNAGRQ
jgi:hypothetical protein